MSRPDLLALTPESLAALANLGLVKRAQRELADGAGPALDELEDGTVVGTFQDGVVARLPRDTPLKQAPCTCGAATVCRHRVAVALAYPAYFAAHANDAASADAATTNESWSPGEFDDATLARVLGEKLLERARATLKKGLIATVEREGSPTANLPSCTVRFHVPHDVAYARCDCALAGGGCEHLALAVWAFRAAPNDASTAVVSLGGGEASEAHHDVLDETIALASDTLLVGIAESAPSRARFAQLRERLSRAGLTWVHALAVDLEVALDGYHARSARFGTREIAALLCELAARARAGHANRAELPARYVLGQDEAPETLLDHVRLVSLGVRLHADERTRFADVYLADPDTTLVLVLRKRWDFDEKTEPEDGVALGRKMVATGVRLEAISRGQVVSKAIRRHANRSIELGSSRVAQTSVTPQRGDFEDLPSPLLIRDLAEHTERVRRRPLRILRSRVLAEEVHVVEISQVVDAHYSAAEQRLFAVLLDASGQRLDLSIQHRRVAPYAIESVAAALATNVRFVAGELRLRHGRWSIDPLSIATDTLVVPDLGGPAPTPVSTIAATARRTDPIERALATAEATLEELCHGGLRAPSQAALARATGSARACEEAGLTSLARRIRAVETQARAGKPEAAMVWLDAAVRVELLREASAGDG